MELERRSAGTGIVAAGNGVSVVCWGSRNKGDVPRKGGRVRLETRLMRRCGAGGTATLVVCAVTDGCCFPVCSVAGVALGDFCLSSGLVFEPETVILALDELFVLGVWRAAKLAALNWTLLQGWWCIGWPRRLAIRL